MAKNVRKPNTSQFLKQFQVLRPQLQLLGHGCYHRKVCLDLLQNKSTPKSTKGTYDKNLPFLRQYLGNYLAETPTGKQLVLHFPNDSYHVLDNQLARLFTIRSISVTRIFYYLLILAIFHAASTPLRFPEIVRLWNDQLPPVLKDKDFWEEYLGNSQQVRRVLQLLVSFGIVHQQGQGKEKRYTLEPDILALLTREEQTELYESIRFYRNVGLLNVPGFYLQQAMEHRFSLLAKPFFQIKNNTFIRITDDEIISQLLEAMQAKKTISFTYRTTPTDEFSKAEKEHTAIPLTITTDYIYTRQYVTVLEGERLERYRLDRVNEIKTAGTLPAKEPPKKTEARRKESVISLHLSYETTAEQQHVYDKIHEKFPHAVIHQDGPHQSHCDLTVDDPRELLPWLRTLHPYARILDSTDRAVADMRERMMTSIKEALANYGIV